MVCRIGVHKKRRLENSGASDQNGVSKAEGVTFAVNNKYAGKDKALQTEALRRMAAKIELWTKDQDNHKRSPSKKSKRESDTDQELLEELAARAEDQSLFVPNIDGVLHGDSFPGLFDTLAFEVKQVPIQMTDTLHKPRSAQLTKVGATRGELS